MPSIADVLVQGSNDRVEIKSRVNLNGEAFKTFKQFIESFNVYEQATKIEERNIGGSVGIYGNPNFGIYGTSYYGDTAVTGFILGSELAGVLGTSKLGETGAEYELSRVIPPNRKFVERFLGTDFINLSSSVNLSGNIAYFTAGEYLESKVVYKNAETISSATITPTFESGDGNISSYISADNGVTFTYLPNGEETTIDVPGEDVIYKLVATGSAQISKLEVQV